MENPSVTRFREYLRIKTVHPNPDYDSAIEWLRGQAKDIGLEYQKIDFKQPALFTIILTWIGKDPRAKSILLNSHIDVVPCDESMWEYDPFKADKDKDGNIYARGTQDMKSVGIQHLEAIRNMKAKGIVPLRNVHVCFVPDEELGGLKGFGAFSKSTEFEKLNIGFGLDEGIANPGESIFLFNTERINWKLEIKGVGPTGHGSSLMDDTAAEKLLSVVNKIMEIRESEKNRMKKGSLWIGDVTSINLTMMEGGLQVNVIPTELKVIFDIRVTPSWNLKEFVERIENITKEVGQVSFTPPVRSDKIDITPVDESNVWWTAFKDSCDQMGLKLDVKCMPGRTDAVFLRERGIPVLGFSPMNNTPILIHGHDEMLNEQIFLKGIKIFENIIEKISNLPKSASP